MSRTPRPVLRRAAMPRFAAPVSGDVSEPPQGALATDDADAPTTEQEAFPLREYPPPTPENNFNVFQMPEPSPPTISFAPVTREDLDTLWDWVRSDRPGTMGFLGREHKNTHTFFAQMASYTELVQQNKAFFTAIRHGGTLVGFVAITLVGHNGNVSLYITPPEREHILAIVSDLLNVVPDQLNLIVLSTDPDMIAAFAANGFERQTVLSRHSHTATGGDASTPPLST